VRVTRFIVPLLLAAAGCVSSRSAGYVDDDPGSPPPYFKSSPKAWTKGRTIIVEIDQPGGTKVAWLDYRIEEDAVYLWPYSISGGQKGTSLLTVDLEREALSDDWQERVFWVSGESYYPMGHSAFWDRSLREPAHRTKILFSPSPD
jgi:hypothetical protein